jgi:adenosylcobinamide-GDP ribazoletransferase
MTDIPDIKDKILYDIPAAFGLLSRLPVPLNPDEVSENAARATWAYPLVGATLGLIAGIIGSVLHWFGAPAGIAAIAALGSLVILTGGMHEDGLADCADGFGGGLDKDRRLEIMKDSRIGAFGAIALILFILGRYTSLEALMDTHMIPALIAVGAASRLSMTLAMFAMPRARDKGLSVSVGKPPETSLIIAIVLTLLICFVFVGWSGIFVLVWALIAATIMGLIAMRCINGQTGDVLGAMQQWGELAALGAAVTAFS